MIRFQDLTVSDVMTPRPLCLADNTTLAEAEQILLDAGIDAAPIVGDAGEYKGSCSLRDLLVARREGGRVETVGGLQSRCSPSCGASLRLAEACQLMIRERAHRVVVLEDQRPVGIVSAVEAARVLACLEDLTQERQHWTVLPFEESHVEEGA